VFVSWLSGCACWLSGKLQWLAGWASWLVGCLFFVWLSFTLSGLGGSPSLPDRKLAGRLGLLVDWLCLLLG